MRPETFQFQGYELPYLNHDYNNASLNMRSVEVPIITMLIQLFSGPLLQVLEIGNVLSHYGEIKWPVLDLREEGCINEDVMKWSPPGSVDVIASISTMEHIEASPPDVVARLRAYLSDIGLLFFTVPTGYREELDQHIRDDTLGTAEMRAMQRISADNEWAECSIEEALAMPFEEGPASGGGMVVGLA